MLFLLASIAIILLICYIYSNSTFDYWKKLNVVYHPPTSFFGNLKDSILLKRSLGQIYTEIYNAHKDGAYVGIFKLRQPSLLVRDRDIVKDILLKDFHYFEKNGIAIDETVDPIAGKNPFFQHGPRWKITRSQFGNCFSSGKIKLIFPLLHDASKHLTKYITDQCENGNAPIETKDLATKYTTDTVATCAFGLEAKAFENPNSEFLKIGQQIVAPTFWYNIKMMIIMVFPNLTNVFRAKFVSESVTQYFRDIIAETLKYRKENNIIRNDFLDVIVQLQDKPGDYDVTEEDIISLGVSFFGDGFETTSITLSFCLYELAKNPTAQQKLREEIQETLKKHGGAVTYDAIQDINYLDCVFQESLRMHPPGMFLLKTCTENYTLPPCVKGGGNVLLEKDTPVVIPVYGLHCDPKNYPDPEKYDPDRFSDERKADIPKGAYLPFGSGPRQCIAMRFAMLQMKTAVVAIIRDFDIRLNQKTKQPLQIDPRHFMLLAKGGLWLNYYKRNK